MAEVVENGYPIFTGLDGLPLDEGYIFIGDAGFNPLTNPQDAFWDEDLTVPAANIRTVSGYAAYQGSPGRLFTEDPFSLLVQDKDNQLVYYQPDSTLSGSSASVVFSGLAGDALSALDVVYRGLTDGKFYKADPTDITKSFVSGFAQTSASINAQVAVINKGVIPGFVGLTIGADYYLDGIGSYAVLASLADTDNATRLGRAISTTEIEVSISVPLFRHNTYLQDQIDAIVGGAGALVDISAGNQTQALAAPTGSGQKVRLGWFGGDGTFTAQLTGYTLYMPDGTGLTAAQAAGEGDGFMEVQDITNRWEIIGYEDTLTVSGASTGGEIFKHIDEMVISHLDTTSRTTASSAGNVFQSNAQAYTFPKAFTAAPVVNPGAHWISGLVWGVVSNVPTTTVFNGRLLGTTNGSQGRQNYTARGDWY